MQAGKDFIGVGCGAVILNEKNQILLLKRSKNAKNQVGYWTIPGGEIDRNETLENCVKREVKEEIGVDLHIIDTLCVLDQIIPEEGQHWVAVDFLGKIDEEPKICEPHKFDDMRWFDLDNPPEKMAEPAIEGIRKLKSNKLINK